MTMWMELFVVAGAGAILGFVIGQESIKYPSSEDMFARLVAERAKKLRLAAAEREVTAEIEGAAIDKAAGAAS